MVNIWKFHWKTNTLQLRLKLAADPLAFLFSFYISYLNLSIVKNSYLLNNSLYEVQGIEFNRNNVNVQQKLTRKTVISNKDELTEKMWIFFNFFGQKLFVSKLSYIWWIYIVIQLQLASSSVTLDNGSILPMNQTLGYLQEEDYLVALSPLL